VYLKKKVSPISRCPSSRGHSNLHDYT